MRGRIEAACLRSGRAAGDVTLLAASKYTDAAGMVYLAAAGQRTFGENRVQDAAGKLAQLPHQLRKAIRVHMIGHLQGNKAQAAAATFDLVESLDSLRLAAALGVAAEARGQRLPVLVQVNVAADPAKAGFGVDDLARAGPELLAIDALEVQGLMTIGRAGEDRDAARNTFRALRELRDRLLGVWPDAALRHLSMGMSGDFEVAIEEGATIVRVGTALFSEPHQPHAAG
ncbi:MAG: YggS family pyridoxal phosphate-dependent enzyme [Candidatus Dormibacteraeota bacterium]|nr:YggS family pyridoxal phosphate-dependent enzyme [Candidatus Dormibacteraeota bacterium]